MNDKQIIEKIDFKENKKIILLLLPIGIISFFIKIMYYEPEIALS